MRAAAGQCVEARLQVRGIDADAPHQLVAKFMGHLWSAQVNHSPLDVVAWHGNYAPYKYDLRRFNAIGSISFDHPDPSIFLVLHSASDTAGVSNIDFVVFAPRTLAMQDTFRPPWFHRNVMSEFMGLVRGEYDAKQGGFVPGGVQIVAHMDGDSAIEGDPDVLKQILVNLVKNAIEALGQGGRIEIADLRERVRKLEAIAAGIDL